MTWVTRLSNTCQLKTQATGEASRGNKERTCEHSPPALCVLSNRRNNSTTSNLLLGARSSAPTLLCHGRGKEYEQSGSKSEYQVLQDRDDPEGSE